MTNNYHVESIYPMGYRASAVYDNRLFVTATTFLSGDSALVEIGDPAGDHPSVTQVSPGDMQIIEISTYNDRLYIGGSDHTGGYYVVSTNASGSPFTFTTVVTGGAGRGKSMQYPIAMSVFKDQLYVSASGWPFGATASELIRISPDDSWQVVVGRPRLTSDGFKYPISGLSDGFGNPFDAFFWRMQSFYDWLYLGTDDTSWLFQSIPGADQLLGSEYGFDVYYTSNGYFWYTATRDAFGDGRYNYGARSMAVSPNTAYLGSTNGAQGTMVWRTGGPAIGTQEQTSSVTTPASAVVPMSGVEADAFDQGNAVTWDPAPQAVRYHVFRADFVSNRSVRLIPAWPSIGTTGELPLVATQNDGGSSVPDIWLPGPFHEIGATTASTFIDRAVKPGGHYAYYVQVEYRNGQRSDPSNVTQVPSQAEPVSFNSIETQVRDLEIQGKYGRADATTTLAELIRARNEMTGGDVQDARSTLVRLSMSLLAGQPRGDQTTREDLGIAVQRLERQVRLDALSRATP